MRTTNVEYSKTFNLGNYSNEKIGIVVELKEGETVVDAIAYAKREVEKAHLFFKNMPLYERSLEVVKDPKNYTGNDVDRAQEQTKQFEETYKDYFTVMGPLVRTLTQGREDNDLGF